MNRDSDLKIFKASAGSGKTYTLAKEFVKILLVQPYHYKNILAITFTKKATAEMKSRILAFLKEIKENKNSNLTLEIIEEIQNEKGVDVSQKIQENAAKAINLILHDYGHFQVTTIDSFFQLIIRSFAKELKLPIGMQIELDTDSVLHKSIIKLLEESETENEIAQWLEEYALNNINNDKSWKIERSIFSLSKELLNEDYILLNEGFEQIRQADFSKYKAIADEQQKIINAYKKHILTKAKEAEKIIKQSGINAKLCSSNCLNGFIKNSKDFNFDSYKTIRKIVFDNGNLVTIENSKKFAEATAKIMSVWDNQLKDIFEEIITFHEKHISKYITASSIQKNIYAMALLDALSIKINEYRSQENVILIADASFFISKIADAEATPFIFEKTSNFINYILIDEFQDTSTLQWKSFMPIVIEILSKGYGLALIVGDAKQSVYRWRGGKMELIIKKVDDDLKHFANLKKEKTLQNNFRSLTNIIEFNNVFFRETIQAYTDFELLSKAYDKQEQTQIEAVKLKKNGGFIRCDWIESSKKTNEEDNEEDIVTENKILNALTERLYELSKKASWKDLAILVRTNLEGIKIANYLQQLENPIPFVSGESLLIKNNLNVQLIIATLEYFISDEIFYKYKLENFYCNYIGIKNYDEIISPKRFFEFEKCFKAFKINKQLKNNKLIDIVHTLIHIYGMDKESNAYVVRLLDDIYKFSQKNGHNIISYLYYWEEKKEKTSILPSDATDAVKIITIHKAKGLEYPIVIIPFANWSLFPKPNSIFWVKSEIIKTENQAIPLSYVKNLENSDFKTAYLKEKELSIIDNINLLYVAFTRAEKELHIFCKQKKSTPDEAKSINDIIFKTLNAAFSENFVTDKHFELGTLTNFEVKVQENDDSNNLKLAPIDMKSKFQLSLSSYTDENTKKGDIVHTLVYNIHRLNLDNIDFYSIQRQYLLTEEDIVYYKNILIEIYKLFINNRFIQAENTYLYEKNFYYKNKVLRADLVIITPNENIIIDYKTGVEEDNHKTQINTYKKAYELMNKQKTKAFLLYTESMTLKEV